MNLKENPNTDFPPPHKLGDEGKSYYLRWQIGCLGCLFPILLFFLFLFLVFRFGLN